MFVHKAALDLPHPLETIGSYLQAHASRAARADGHRPDWWGAGGRALILGISEPTVRTHLQSVFKKTDTSRQADLVKLVAGYMSPLAANIPNVQRKTGD